MHIRSHSVEYTVSHFYEMADLGWEIDRLTSNNEAEIGLASQVNPAPGQLQAEENLDILVCNYRHDVGLPTPEHPSTLEVYATGTTYDSVTTRQATRITNDGLVVMARRVAFAGPIAHNAVGYNLSLNDGILQQETSVAMLDDEPYAIEERVFQLYNQRLCAIIELLAGQIWLKSIIQDAVDRLDKPPFGRNESEHTSWQHEMTERMYSHDKRIVPSVIEDAIRTIGAQAVRIRESMLYHEPTDGAIGKPNPDDYQPTARQLVTLIALLNTIES